MILQKTCVQHNITHCTIQYNRIFNGYGMMTEGGITPHRFPSPHIGSRLLRCARDSLQGTDVGFSMSEMYKYRENNKS